MSNEPINWDAEFRRIESLTPRPELGATNDEDGDEYSWNVLTDSIWKAYQAFQESGFQEEAAEEMATVVLAKLLDGLLA